VYSGFQPGVGTSSVRAGESQKEKAPDFREPTKKCVLKLIVPRDLKLTTPEKKKFPKSRWTLEISANGRFAKCEQQENPSRPPRR
jgi:hypothetical protein